jgi:hypothetical protein
MADEAVVPVDLLRKLVDYDPKTGVLTWKPRPIEMFERRRLGLAWNTRYAGTLALNHADRGYRSGSICGVKVYAHRAAFALLTGRWPENVDHINGDQGDNRAENLREVDHATNLRNTKRRVDNRSGASGVFWNTRERKWEARIRVGQRDIYLGRYDDLEQAKSARKRAEPLYGFHENHGRAV